ncbi:NrdH-redoxin [Candidatus Woesearchaeota archaeon]|jgi:glutaredoxin 3|nr:NrdH-redoxin [Candidatus Woesearchaeota archaeon]MBT5740502.1 NrdH-redoxin [Candidatus Woesearchaeota archaeon]
MHIKTYTRPLCKWSKKLKEWLEENNYDYEDLELTEETTWRDEHIEKSGQLGTPVIDVDGEILLGFNKEKLEKVIKKSAAQ